MKSTGAEVQLEWRGAALAILAVVLVSIYQAMYYLAPDILAQPLWEGSALTVAFLLGTLSIVIPVVFGWWMIRSDTADGETYETTEH